MGKIFKIRVRDTRLGTEPKEKLLLWSPRQMPWVFPAGPTECQGPFTRQSRSHCLNTCSNGRQTCTRRNSGAGQALEPTEGIRRCLSFGLSDRSYTLVPFSPIKTL